MTYRRSGLASSVILLLVVEQNTSLPIHRPMQLNAVQPVPDLTTYVCSSVKLVTAC